MAYGSLADFLEDLASGGQLARTSALVDPVLEIAEVTRRVARQCGPALLFEQVSGSSLAVVTNLLGSESRVCRALAIDSLDEIGARTEGLIQRHTPQNWFDRLKTSGDEAGANKFRPKPIKTGACQQVVRLGRDVDLSMLPLVKSWPDESGPAITAGRIVSLGRAGGERCVTVCPLVRLDANRLAVVDAGRGELARHWAEYRAANAKMPVAVVLGGDPAHSVAARLDLPEAADPYHMTGLLRCQALDVVKCRTHELEVPADADVVLEGYLDPDDAGATAVVAAAGASHYQTVGDVPVLHVAAITQRSHAIMPALIDSGMHGEAAALSKARERLLLPAVQAVVPGVVDLHLPPYAAPQHFAFVSIRKAYPYHARQVACALWGWQSLRFTKYLVIVDSEVNVRDTPGVLAEIGAHVAPEHDLFSYDGPGQAPSHGTPEGALQRHLGIDATAKIAGERSRLASVRLVPSDEIVRLVAGRWEQYQLDLPDRGPG
ncbi:MAG TPA: UbiD family decarboxylase [Pirellulales bacterium]|jgi:4-hydroxy-3-polyprenylbenzoate decarboxylase|nr:UbiD family decarboxylase [Pirellulales bacterium]